MTVPKTIELKFLRPGNKFKIPGWTVKVGELIECFEGGDAKVKIYNGTKVDVSWYASGSEVIPEGQFVTLNDDIIQTDSKDIVVKSNVLANSGNTFGLTGLPGRINSAVTNIPQSIDEIASKARCTKFRAIEHFDWWTQKKRGIGLVLIEKNGKYWIEK
ncbi:hypothetical protein C4577_06625 [Candidatus Parcubacteria bacterium]|nr:MAG: hypothetical protein C4577_06625 [Candidatus Parcubacteria bacterium]